MATTSNWQFPGYFARRRILHWTDGNDVSSRLANPIRAEILIEFHLFRDISDIKAAYLSHDEALGRDPRRSLFLLGI